MKKEFTLTASLEDYLEAIKELMVLNEHGHAHTSDIAKRLNVKMPSVTNALWVLSRNGYINYDTNYPVTLTEAGEAAADRVIRRHRALAHFFHKVLLLDEKLSSETACRVEHVINEEVRIRLERLSNALLSAPEKLQQLRALFEDRGDADGEEPAADGE